MGQARREECWSIALPVVIRSVRNTLSLQFLDADLPASLPVRPAKRHWLGFKRMTGRPRRRFWLKVAAGLLFAIVACASVFAALWDYDPFERIVGPWLSYIGLNG